MTINQNGILKLLVKGISTLTMWMMVLLFSFSTTAATEVLDGPSGVYKSKKISGKVTDENGQPLSGVSIRVKGNQSIGTTTNDIGSFTLNVADNAVLIISYVGYETIELQTLGKEEVVVVLKRGTGNTLGDVVIVGYQKQSLKKATSAVQVITGKEIENLPAPSFDQLLQGRTSGVNIQNFSGEPGVRNTFTVRGNSTMVMDLNSGIDQAATLSTPLFVIDGIPMSISDLESVSSTGTNMLAGININDIESIVVQKDAAATSAWGSRGANGVVIIKTKRGRLGKPVYKFSYYTGITQKPELLTTVAGAEERAQKLGLMRTYGTYGQLQNIPQILTDSLNPYFNNATDWQDLFYRTGKVNNADLSISAGSELLSYRLGLNYYDELGIVRNTGFSRYALRGNFDFKLSEKVNALFNISASILDRKRGLGRGRNDVLPIDGVTMPASFYRLSQDDLDFFYGQYDKLKDKNKTEQLSTYLQVNYDILKGLQYSIQGSYSKNVDRRDQFLPTTITSDGRSYARSSNNTFQQAYIANVVTFNKSFGDKTHNIGLVATQSFQYDQTATTYADGYNVPDDNIQVVSGIPQKDLYAYSSFAEAGLLSYVGQLSYDYKEKYILNASYRADASSRFGKNSKWGYFPAISLSWIVSEEPFIKNIHWISLLKFRGSYGLSGTQPQDFYAPYNVWDLNQGTYNGTIIATPSFSKPITQDNLTWNKSSQGNIGMDLYMFKNRLNVTVDLYRRYNSNPILSFPFPFYTGYENVVFNAPVKILNEGVDLEIKTRNLSPKSALQWTTNINMTYNKNRIAALPNGNRSYIQYGMGYNQQVGFTVGRPIYSWVQMLYDGVYQNQSEIPTNPLTGQPLTYFKTYYTVKPGYPKWIDVNKDWDVWSDEDKGEQYGDLVATGDPNPRFTGGIYNEFVYKNFSIGILGTYTIGRDIINNFESNQFSNVWNFGGINNFASQRLPDLSRYNYWTPTNNQNANFPAINPYDGGFYQFLPFSTMWNENGSYFKLKSITLGYSVSKGFIKRLKLTNVRFFGILDNLLIISKSNVPDPELVTPQGEYTGSAYPLPKKYTIGIDITF